MPSPVQYIQHFCVRLKQFQLLFYHSARALLILGVALRDVISGALGLASAFAQEVPAPEKPRSSGRADLYKLTVHGFVQFGPIL